MNTEQGNRSAGLAAVTWSTVDYVEAVLAPSVDAVELAVANDRRDDRVLQVVQATLCQTRHRLLVLADRLEDEGVDLVVSEGLLHDIDLLEINIGGNNS